MIVMGRIVAPFGVRGWLKVNSWAAPPEGLLQYEDWWLSRGDGDWQEAKVAEGQMHGNNVLVRLDGCDDRGAAERYKGLEVCVPRGALPPASEGEYYWADLVGMEVDNRQGDLLGTVSGLLETGANDVLVVQGDRERLIPFTTPVVVGVDAAARRITVDWELDY